MTNLFRQVSIASLFLIALSSATPPAYAAAFCALRDPTASIYELFPAANNYRSSVRTVGRGARAAVIDELPFNLHFNELGRHTLYIAFRDERVAGFVHSRSELGEWGITEYVWAIAPDGTIEDVRVQRSRDPFVGDMAQDKMSALVKGKSLQELKQDYFKLMGEPLETSVLASAMKTLVITNAVWGDELERSKSESIDNQQSAEKDATSLDVARQLNPKAHSVSRVSLLYAPRLQQILMQIGLPESPAFDRVRNVGYLVDNREGAGIGLLVRTPFTVTQPKRFLWWYVGYDGSILGVINEFTMQHDSDFDSVIGNPSLDIQSCSTLADLAALEITTLSKYHL